MALLIHGPKGKGKSRGRSGLAALKGFGERKGSKGKDAEEG